MKTKKNLVAVATVLIFLAISYAYADVYVWQEISPNGVNVHPGDIVGVTVKVVFDEYVTIGVFGIHMYYNRATLRLSGYSPGDLLPEPTWSAIGDHFYYLGYGQFVLQRPEFVLEPGVEYTAVTLWFQVAAYDIDDLDIFAAKFYREPDMSIIPAHFNNEASFNNLIQPDFTYTPANPLEDDTIYFDASSTIYNPIVWSVDSYGNYTKYYKWNFGDGTGAEGITTNHSYSSAGSYTVTLTVGYTYVIPKEVSISKTITVYALETVDHADVDLVRRSAWPEHHHFVISKDEDGLQTLYAKVRNFSTTNTYLVKVKFVVNGNQTLYSDTITLLPGEMKNISLSKSFAPGKYTVTAQVRYFLDGVAGFKGNKVKRFGFAVVE